MQRWLERLKNFADRGWYAPLVGLLAGADQFIVVVPIEWLMIPSVLLAPKRWLRTALWVATGCTLGAWALAWVANVYGITLLEHWAPHVVQSQSWARSLHFIDQYGAWALFATALSPFPQQPAVALAGLSHMDFYKVVLAVWSARTIKYGTVAYIASHAPALLVRLFPNSKPDSTPNQETHQP